MLSKKEANDRIMKAEAATGSVYAGWFLEAMLENDKLRAQNNNLRADLRAADARLATSRKRERALLVALSVLKRRRLLVRP